MSERFIDSDGDWRNSTSAPKLANLAKLQQTINNAGMGDPRDAEIAKLRGLLREVEWRSPADITASGYCCVCGRVTGSGHLPDCRLAAALGDGT